MASSDTILTHWGQDKIAAILKATIFRCIFLDENVWISNKISPNMFIGVQLTIFKHWFRLWLGTDHDTSNYLNQWWLVYWRIYASLCLNEPLCRTHLVPSQKISWRKSTYLPGSHALSSFPSPFRQVSTDMLHRSVLENVLCGDYSFPTGTRRKSNVIMTSKQRRDVVLTSNDVISAPCVRWEMV